MTTEAADPSFRAAGIAPGSIDGVPMHRGELRMLAAEAKWQDQEAEKKKLPTQHKHGMQFEGGYVRPAASDDLEGAAPGGDAGSATPFQPLARKDYLDRWAPKQKDHIEAHRLQSAEHSSEYNIWYGKYEGDRMHQRGDERAAGRCCIATDAGKTLADTRAKGFFCIHFARGLCAKGKECTYHHHLPTPADEKRIGKLHDCFGRERHATDREDMMGVGNFIRESRTLYVGRIKALPKHELEEQIYRHFSEFGDIQEYRVVEKKQIAFVRFYNRMNAEFAREAMMEQPLDDDEILNVRWAHDDPNPKAIERNKRERIEEGIQQIEAMGHSLVEAPYDYPVGYQMPPEKRVCREGELGDGASAYPNTDGQYAGMAPMTQEQIKFQEDQKKAAEEAEKEKEDVIQKKLETAASVSLLDSLLDNIGGGEAGEPVAHVPTMEEGAVWWSQVSPEGHAYYVNSVTGESVWEAPAGAVIQPGEQYQQPQVQEGATQYEKFQAQSLAKAATAEPDFSEYAQKEQWDQKQAHAESGGVGAWGYYSDNFKEARVANETQYVNYKDQ